MLITDGPIQHQGGAARTSMVYKEDMTMDIIRELENEQLKSNVTPFNVGDTVRVYAKVVEGTRERLQMFEGDRKSVV